MAIKQPVVFSFNTVRHKSGTFFLQVGLATYPGVASYGLAYDGSFVVPDEVPPDLQSKKKKVGWFQY